MEHADYARVKAFQEQSGTRKELIVKADFSYDQSYDKALDAAFRQWRFLTLPPDKLAILRTPNAFEATTQSITKEDIARDVKIITSAQEAIEWIDELVQIGFHRIILHNVNRNQYERKPPDLRVG